MAPPDKLQHLFLFSLRWGNWYKWTPDWWPDHNDDLIPPTHFFFLAIIIKKWMQYVSSRLNKSKWCSWPDWYGQFSFCLPTFSREVEPVPLHALCSWERSRYQRQADCCRPSLPALYLASAAWWTGKPMGRADPGSSQCPRSPTSKHWCFVVALTHSFPCLAVWWLWHRKKQWERGLCHWLVLKWTLSGWPVDLGSSKVQMHWYCTGVVFFQVLVFNFFWKLELFNPHICY